MIGRSVVQSESEELSGPVLPAMQGENGMTTTYNVDGTAQQESDCALRPRPSNM